MAVLGEMIWPLFLIGGLGLALLLIWVWLRRGRVRPGRRTRGVFWACEAALGGLSLWFSWRLGSPIYFLIFVAMIFPLLRLWQEIAVQAATPTAARTGRISVLQSPWLILRIDHDSGACTGQLLRGTLRDWQLQEMDNHDLQQMRGEIFAADAVGTAMFDFWLDRHGPLQWRKEFGGGKEIPQATPPIPQPARDEAAALLGLEPQARPADIDDACARLHDLLGEEARHGFIASWIAAARSVLVA